MTVGRIAPLEPVQNNKSIQKPEQAIKKSQGDSISISAEAKENAALHQAMEIVLQAPDVRADRVAELKEKINDPAYINETILNGTADKIIDMLLPPN